jgi:hypothetical protein
MRAMPVLLAAVLCFCAPCLLQPAAADDYQRIEGSWECYDYVNGAYYTLDFYDDSSYFLEVWDLTPSYYDYDLEYGLLGFYDPEDEDDEGEWFFTYFDEGELVLYDEEQEARFWLLEEFAGSSGPFSGSWMHVAEVESEYIEPEVMMIDFYDDLTADVFVLDEEELGIFELYQQENIIQLLHGDAVDEGFYIFEQGALVLDFYDEALYFWPVYY